MQNRRTERDSSPSYQIIWKALDQEIQRINQTLARYGARPRKKSREPQKHRKATFTWFPMDDKECLRNRGDMVVWMGGYW